VKFYDESVRLWQDLAKILIEPFLLDARPLHPGAYRRRMRTMRWRAEVNKHFGSARRRSMPRSSSAASVDRHELRRPCTHSGALFHEPGPSLATMPWRGLRRERTGAVSKFINDGSHGIRVAGGASSRGHDRGRSRRRRVVRVAGFTPRLLDMWAQDPDLRASPAGHGVRTVKPCWTRSSCPARCTCTSPRRHAANS